MEAKEYVEGLVEKARVAQKVIEAAKANGEID